MAPTCRRTSSAQRFETSRPFERRTIVYCGGGVSAGLDAIALTMLGHQDLAIYDGSMFEWCADPALPLVTRRRPRLKTRVRRHHPASLPGVAVLGKDPPDPGLQGPGLEVGHHSHGGAQTRPDAADRRISPHAGAADRCGRLLRYRADRRGAGAHRAHEDPLPAGAARRHPDDCAVGRQQPVLGRHRLLLPDRRRCHGSCAAAAGASAGVSPGTVRRRPSEAAPATFPGSHLAIRSRSCPATMGSTRCRANSCWWKPIMSRCAATMNAPGRWSCISPGSAT